MKTIAYKSETWENHLRKSGTSVFLMEIGGTLGVRPGISRNMTEIERTMHGKLQKKRGCFPRFSLGIWDGIYIYNQLQPSHCGRINSLHGKSSVK